jgi:hypothetical protein
MKHTLVSNDIDPPAMFRNADGMVLHPRASPNISENQHLDGDLGFELRCIGRLISRFPR